METIIQNPPATNAELFYTVEEFLTAYGIARITLSRNLKHGLPHSFAKRPPGVTSGRPRMIIPKAKADAWMAANSQRVISNINTKATAVPTASAPPKMLPAAPPKVEYESEDEEFRARLSQLRMLELETLEVNLPRAREAVSQSYGLWLQACQAGDQTLIAARLRNYTESLRVVHDLEKLRDVRIDLYNKILNELVQSFKDWAERARTLLDAMPKAMASRVNPQNTALAEAELQRWINETFLPVVSTPPAKVPDEKANLTE